MKKLLCAVLALALVFLPVGGSVTAYAEDKAEPVTAFTLDAMTASSESDTVTVEAGIYKVPVSASNVSDVDGLDAVLSDSAAAIVHEDGTVTLTLGFDTTASVTVDGSAYTVWIQYVGGVNKLNSNVSVDATVSRDETGAVQAAVLTCSSVENTYDTYWWVLSTEWKMYHLVSIVVDWANAEALPGAGSYESSSASFCFRSVYFGTYADYDNPESVKIGEEFVLTGLFPETDDTESDYDSITWTCSDDSIAEVTNTGSLEINDFLVDAGETDMQYGFAITLKALRPGDVTITGTMADGETASYTLHVLPRIALTGDSTTTSTAVWTCTVFLDYADADFLAEYMEGLSFYTAYEVEDEVHRASDWNGDSSYSVSSDGLSAVLTMEFVPDGSSGSTRHVAVKDADGYVTTSSGTLTYYTTNISLVFTDENGEAYDYQDNVNAVWTGSTYSPEEIYVSVSFTYYPSDPDETVTLTDVAFAFSGADAFKVDTGSISGSDDLTLSYGESYSGTVTLVKQGLLWDVPDEGETDTGTLTGTVACSDGTSWTDTATVYVTNPSDDESDTSADDEDTGLSEEEEAALADAVEAYEDIESSMALDARLDSYLGSGWTDAQKAMIYTEICAVNMSEEYWEETGLSEKAAKGIISKFLKVDVSSVDLGVVNTTIPMSTLVETSNYGTVLVSFTANINNFTAADDPYAMFGSIETELTLYYGTDDAQNVALSDGIITKTDMEAFTKAVWSLAQKQLKSAYGTGIKVDSVLEKLGSSYVSEKYGKYLLVEPVKMLIEELQTVGILKKLSTFQIICGASTMIIAHCTVDLYIYDADGNLVGQTDGDEVVTADDDIVLYTQGASKVAVLYDSSYTVSYVSTGTGTMTLEVYDNANTDTALRICTFEGVPLADGVSYTQTVNSVLLSDAAEYALLSSENETIEADMITYAEIVSDDTDDRDGSGSGIGDDADGEAGDDTNTGTGDDTDTNTGTGDSTDTDTGTGSDTDAGTQNGTGSGSTSGPDDISADSNENNNGVSDTGSGSSTGSSGTSNSGNNSNTALQSQKITIKRSSFKKKIKYKKLKKKKYTFKLKASTTGNGKITYAKVGGSKKIKISKKGKVTIKKGLKKGQYMIKVRITAAKTSTYKKSTLTTKLKITVK